MLTQKHHTHVDQRVQRRKMRHQSLIKHSAKKWSVARRRQQTSTKPQINLPVMEFLLQSGYEDPILYGHNDSMDCVPGWLQLENAARFWPIKQIQPIEVEQPGLLPERSVPFGALTAAAMGSWAFIQLLSTFSFGTLFMCLAGLLFAEQSLPVPSGYRRLFQGGTVLTIIAVIASVVLR